MLTLLIINIYAPFTCVELILDADNIEIDELFKLGNVKLTGYS